MLRGVVGIEMLVAATRLVAMLRGVVVRWVGAVAVVSLGLRLRLRVVVIAIRVQRSM